jgi:hypothetical protein
LEEEALGVEIGAQGHDRPRDSRRAALMERLFGHRRRAALGGRLTDAPH